MTRRDLLKGFGAALAVQAVSSTGLVRPALAAPATPATGTLWTNKHRNLTTRVDQYFDVWNGPSSSRQPWRSGCDALRGILDDAQAKGRRVRAVGGRWSLSPVAISPDVMINTQPLNYHSVGLPPAHVSSTLVDPSNLVFAQCGTSVKELNRTLESCGLSMPTSGASNGQTICGAIATGTHGSARQVGSMQDFMLGLHVLTEDGRSCWIERASRPVVSDEFCDQLGATLVRDDRLFRAAVVSFGSFGIVHAVLFEASPIYLLDVRRRRMDWPDVERVIGTLDVEALGFATGGEDPFHVDVVLNPYRAKRGGKGALVTAMWKRPYRDLPRRPTLGVKLVPGVDLLGMAGKFATVLPGTIPAGVSSTFDNLAQQRKDVVGTPGAVFDDTELIGTSLSAEVGVDIRDAGTVLEMMVGEAREYPFPGTLGIRYVRKSDALLAFTRFDTTCTIEMTGAGSARTLRYYDRVWSALDTRGIASTEHWGKVNNMDRSSVRRRWGASADDWVAARNAFLGPAGRAMFANDLLARCGMDR